MGLVRKTVVQLVEDLDGTALTNGAAKTASFGVDGVSYEVDLSQAHVDELTGALAPCVAVARKISGRRSAAPMSGSKSAPAEPQKIRDWAGKNGHTVSSRGRVAAAVRDAYSAAQ
jgi:hypothetical protein